MTPHEYAGSNRDPTTYFTDLAEAYHQHRPGYPSSAIDSIMNESPSQPLIADVGSGTGIAARLLARRGARVIGIEPSEGMRRTAEDAQTEFSDGSITYRGGTGEATGLEENAVDGVVCAQAFHWFDAPRALAEFHRILVPDGRLFLMWNLPDDNDPFSAEYARLMREAKEQAASTGRLLRRNQGSEPTEGGYFTDVRTEWLPNRQILPWEGVYGRAASSSYFPTQGERREQLLRRLRDAFDRHAESGEVILRYRTRLLIATRSS